MNKKALRKLIQEELVSLGGNQYQLNSDEVESVEQHLITQLDKQPFNPMSRTGAGKKGKIDVVFADDPDWKGWMKRVGYPEDWDGGEAPEDVLIPPEKMQKLYFTLYDLTSSTFAASYIDYVLDAIYSANPEQFAKDLFSKSGTEAEVPVPASMLGLADINTKKGGNKATETGRGEFVIPFLFDDARMGGGNAVHDVVIGGLGWHVKEIPRPNDGIRLGMNSYADSALSSLLQSEVGMSGKELAVGDRKGTKVQNSVLANLSESQFPGKKSIVEALGAPNASAALQDLQDRLDSDMREKGIDPGAGVAFYVPSAKTIYFTPTDQCVCVAASQGAHKVSRRKIGPFAEMANSVVSESLVRSVVKELLLFEELTKTDKAEIKRIAKKQAKSVLDSELDKALGTSFFGNKGKVNKFVEDEISKRFKAGDKDKDFADAVEKVAKRVLQALYTMHYKRNNLIKTMPVPKG